MANPAVTGNRLLKDATILATSGTTSVSLADLQMTGEVLNSVSVKRIFYSGNVAIGNSSVNFLYMNGSDHIGLDQSAFSVPPLTSVKVTLSANGFCLLKVSKNAVLTPSTAATVTNFEVNP